MQVLRTSHQKGGAMTGYVWRIAAAVAALLAAPGANANLTLPLTRCSGALAIMQGMAFDQKALAFTNGHCTGFGSFKKQFPDQGEIFIDRPARGVVLVGNEKAYQARFDYRRLLFASMTGTDLAVLELDRSYDEIRQQLPQMTIYTVSKERAVPGMKTNIISARNNLNLTCTVEGIVPRLREGPWTWSNFIRFQHGCNLSPGSSGSPVIVQGTDQVIALGQTGVDGGVACEINNPCEVQTDGSTIVAPVGQSYAAPTAVFYDCYDGSRFDFALPSCALARR
jgi:hypothetical protein